MRVLVCGGRNFLDYVLLSSTLTSISPDSIIHGGAGGADSLAGRYASEHRLRCYVFPADWSTFGRSAGPICNLQMLKEGHPDLVLAFPGGPGTRNMIALSAAAGTPTWVVSSTGSLTKFGKDPVDLEKSV